MRVWGIDFRRTTFAEWFTNALPHDFYRVAFAIAKTLPRSAQVAPESVYLMQASPAIRFIPVRNGIVDKPEDYLCSSARNYAGLDSIIDVIEVDFKWKTYG